VVEVGIHAPFKPVCLRDWGFEALRSHYERRRDLKRVLNGDIDYE